MQIAINMYIFATYKLRVDRRSTRMELVTDREVGKRILKARKACGMSPSELADKAGISLSFLQKIECGARHTSDATKIKIANALKRPVTELFY